MATESLLRTEMAAAELSKDDNAEEAKKEEEPAVDMSLFRDPKNKKREVYTQLNLTHFGDVSNTEQTFHGHFQMDLYWVATYEEKKQWDAHGQDENAWKPSWIPQQTIMRLSNAIEVIQWDVMLDTKERDIVLLPRWGKLMWRRRYLIIAVFIESFELESFPFDVQNFSMTIQAVEHMETWELLPLPVPDGNAFIKLKKQFSPLSEWVFETGCVEFHGTDPADSFSGKQFSQVTLDVKCIRRWQIYFYNMMLPMSLLSGMGLTSFSISLDEGSEGRLGYSINILFTIVAYQFVVQSQLPQIAYLTYMDRYVFGSFLYAVFLLLQPAIVCTFFQESPDLLDTIDLICFVAALVLWVGLQVAFTIYGQVAWKSEKSKLMKSGSEINYGPDTDPTEYEVLLVDKKHARKTRFGMVYFEKNYEE